MIVIRYEFSDDFSSFVMFYEAESYYGKIWINLPLKPLEKALKTSKNDKLAISFDCNNFKLIFTNFSHDILFAALFFIKPTSASG